MRRTNWARACALAWGLLAAAALGCAHTPPRVDPTSLRLSMARQLIEREDWRGAFEVLERLYRDRPDDAEVLTLRGIVYRETGLLAEARVELEAATQKDPQSAAAVSALAILLDQIGEHEQAGQLHRRAVELEPRNAAYLNNLAFSSFVRGRLEEAIAGFEEALRIEPMHPRIRNNLGFACARAGQLEKAAEHFSRAGTPAQTRHNLAYAHELAGDLARAYELYAQAVRLAPECELSRRGLEQVASRLGRQLPPDLAEARAHP
ncbi:MAG: tetratricopeptide repeat protein [Myxococcales bacterium]|jgi:Flp pilus assembly protein TadD